MDGTERARSTSPTGSSRPHKQAERDEDDPSDEAAFSRIKTDSVLHDNKNAPAAESSISSIAECNFIDFDVQTCSWTNVPLLLRHALLGADAKHKELSEKQIHLTQAIDRIEANLQKKHNYYMSQMNAVRSLMDDVRSGKRGKQKKDPKGDTRGDPRIQAMVSPRSSDGSISHSPPRSHQPVQPRSSLASVVAARSALAAKAEAKSNASRYGIYATAAEMAREDSSRSSSPTSQTAQSRQKRATLSSSPSVHNVYDDTVPSNSHGAGTRRTPSSTSLASSKKRSTLTVPSVLDDTLSECSAQEEEGDDDDEDWFDLPQQDRLAVNNLSQKLNTLENAEARLRDTVSHLQVVSDRMESRVAQLAKSVTSELGEVACEQMIEMMPKWMKYIGAIENSSFEAARTFFQDVVENPKSTSERLTAELSEIHDRLSAKIQGLEMKLLGENGSENGNEQDIEQDGIASPLSSRTPTIQGLLSHPLSPKTEVDHTYLSPKNSSGPTAEDTRVDDVREQRKTTSGGQQESTDTPTLEGQPRVTIAPGEMTKTATLESIGEIGDTRAFSTKTLEDLNFSRQGSKSSCVSGAAGKQFRRSATTGIETKTPSIDGRGSAYKEQLQRGSVNLESMKRWLFELTDEACKATESVADLKRELDDCSAKAEMSEATSERLQLAVRKLETDFSEDIQKHSREMLSLIAEKNTTLEEVKGKVNNLQISSQNNEAERDTNFQKLLVQVEGQFRSIADSRLGAIEQESAKLYKQLEVVFPRATKERGSSSFSVSEARWFTLDARIRECEEQMVQIRGNTMSRTNSKTKHQMQVDATKGKSGRQPQTQNRQRTSANPTKAVKLQQLDTKDVHEIEVDQNKKDGSMQMLDGNSVSFPDIVKRIDECIETKTLLVDKDVQTLLPASIKLPSHNIRDSSKTEERDDASRAKCVDMDLRSKGETGIFGLPVGTLFQFPGSSVAKASSASARSSSSSPRRPCNSPEPHDETSATVGIEVDSESGGAILCLQEQSLGGAVRISGARPSSAKRAERPLSAGRQHGQACTNFPRERLAVGRK